MAMTETVSTVTLCPPGKRSREIRYREPVEAGPPVTTQTALQWPAKASLVPPARNDRRTAQERVEAALRAEAVSVALAQPHRAGCDAAMLVEPLGRFCRAAWPVRRGESGFDLNEAHREAMYDAGRRYADVVHRHRVAMGLGAGGKTQAEGLSVARTATQIAADCEAARIKRDAADAALRAVFAGAIAVLMRVAVDERDPAPHHEGVLRHGLYALAVHFGIVKPGFHAGS